MEHNTKRQHPCQGGFPEIKYGKNMANHLDTRGRSSRFNVNINQLAITLSSISVFVFSISFIFST